MAMLRKVKAVMSTLLEISSIQEIPEAKKYLMMTFVEIMTRRNAKKRDARIALIKWIRFKISLTFIRSKILSGGNIIGRRAKDVKGKMYWENVMPEWISGLT
jgi:hypothetical protein